MKRWQKILSVVLGVAVLLGGAAFAYDRNFAYQLIEREIEESLPGVDVSDIELVQAGDDSYYISMVVYITSEYERERAYIDFVGMLMFFGYGNFEQPDPIGQAAVEAVMTYLPHRTNIYVVHIDYTFEFSGEEYKDLSVFASDIVIRSVVSGTRVGTTLCYVTFQMLEEEE